MLMIYRLSKTSLIFLVLFSILCGVVYPGAVWLAGKAFFPWQAEGSLLVNNGQKVGSELLGQDFSGPKYFWGRMSATSPFPYNTANSSGSNLGPLNPDLAKAVKDRVQALQRLDPRNQAPIPIDLVTASGSGLDPQISPEAARFQAGRVAKARKMDVKLVEYLIRKYTEKRTWGFLGEDRVNVLTLNLALDNIQNPEQGESRINP